MNPDGPAALFLTWTVYGTFLPGDARGWFRRGGGPQPPSPTLQRWHAENLTYPVRLLSFDARTAAAKAMGRKCIKRGWLLHAAAVRCNHAHAVVTAAGRSPRAIRDQLKAIATRDIRRLDPGFADRPVWTEGGWIEYLDDDADIEACVQYCLVAQDRKERDLPAAGSR